MAFKPQYSALPQKIRICGVVLFKCQTFKAVVQDWGKKTLGHPLVQDTISEKSKQSLYLNSTSELQHVIYQFAVTVKMCKNTPV